MKKDTAMLPLCTPVIGAKEIEYVSRCLRSGEIAHAGEFILGFENQLQHYFSAKEAILTTSGTAALHLSLLLSGIGPGDEVIVPALSFVATVNPVIYCGAQPRFADAEFSSWNMAPESIEAQISNKTKAVIATSIYGNPANLNQIQKICKKHHLLMIEDACESLGAKHNNQLVGTFGDLTCLSFNANKVVTAAGGGAILFKDTELATRGRALATQCKSDGVKWLHNEIGYNYAMTNYQAALGLAQFEQINTALASKRRIANLYQQELTNLQGLTPHYCLPKDESSYWLYSILVDQGKRDSLLAELRNQGIDARPFFQPLPTLPMFHSEHAIPMAQELGNSGLSLPSSSNLTTCDQERVIAAIKEWHHKKGDSQ
jgi:dTDP-4-amino-4,6-dideoxygalactose transaminase